MNTRGFKICLFVSFIFVIIIVAVILALVFTIFKPKNPVVHVYPLGLKDLQFFQPNVTSVPLGMLITVLNPNYGSYKFKNTTGYLNYKDIVVAKAPIGSRVLHARRTTNVSAIAGLMSGKLIADEGFLSDIEDGSFNFTAKATLYGKVHLINVVKVKATVNISCDIFFNLTSLYTDSYCITKIML
ncbi:uncharacterized protein LOC123922140 [Trifolium pratense]|uniref:uncharacterized protein LOC123922140 n=1 Tax=Trifolium pratense TaxID=57577 RepID=UPI001E694939|nr:uncharacterized protein LOC123922140 [Trifolium pratense]